ncbi:MAG TPA: hypothetical protein PLU11_12775 [Chitinophagaceae bacterium]|nr:hypothetical protein [Chitinophagaceae bacterium]HPH33264.1 hypothetical protein [Chitinophagaceae bacterium]HPN60050.1 hypothetical protein [Chitinophagaceae bacterium]
MSSRSRANKKFWNKVFRLTLIYLLIVPVIFYLLDKSSVSNDLKNTPVGFILKMAGIAFGISLIISFWGHRDPELRKY